MVCHLYLKTLPRGEAHAAAPAGANPASSTEGDESIMNDKATPAPTKGAPPKAGQKPAPAAGAKPAPVAAAKPAAPAPAASKPATAAPGAPIPSAAADDLNKAHANGASNGDGKKESYQKRMAKLPIPKRFSVKVKRTSGRLGRLVGITDKWEQDVISKAGAAAIAALDAYAAELEKLPDEFKPPKSTRSSAASPLAVGAIVDLNAATIKRYSDVIEEADRVGLTVKKVVGSKLICTTKSGEKIVLLRGQVRVAASEEDTGDDDADDDEDEDEDDDEN
jgi:hypothetical protein